MLPLKHTLQQLLDMNLAGEEGPGPSSGSAEPTLSGWLLQETPWAAAGSATGVQQRRVKAQEVMDVLLTMSSPPQECEECWKGGFWEG